MKTAAVSKLKATLSEQLGYVKAGEEILVTERGKPIAKIVPVDPAAMQDARRMDLARRGIITLGKGPISKELLDRLPVVRIPDEVLQRVMDEVRGEY